MTENDADYSAFWSRGANRAEAPTATNLYIGKHVGQDSDKTRNDEILGYIVIEQGSGSINGLNYTAALGADIVAGTGDNPEYTYNVNTNGKPVTAIASLSGMDGPDGGWAVLYGNDPLSSNFFDPNELNLAIEEDTAADAERKHATEQVAYIVFSDPSIAKYPNIRSGELHNISDQWQTINLDHTYKSMVVVATVVAEAGDPPLVARVRNATGNSFELKIQRTDGLVGPVAGISVQYLAVEEGVFNQVQHGITLEAVKFNSTQTDSRTSWLGEQRTYLNTYTAPVVVGQVMTENDSDFSAFWARGANRTLAPSPTDFYIGKQVAEDSDKTRADETIGYIVIEQGSGTVNGLNYTAGVGGQTVQGVGNNPAYTYTINLNGEPLSAVTSSAGMNGVDGAWSVLYGKNALTNNSLNLAAMEDQLQDAEQKHAVERVAYIAFSNNNTALDTYVNTPDPSYGYTLNDTIVDVGYTTYVFDLTSQTWRTIAEVDKPVWKHWVTMIVPDGASSETAVLFIDGGSNTASQPTAPRTDALNFALNSGLVVINVRTIPSEPLLFSDQALPRTEDEIIAYTYDKWLNGGDDEWPLLLPMVKSAVAAMDMAQDFAPTISQNFEDFIVTGQSKRGWTTWLTAAVDPRVKAIAPIVIDVLNIDSSMMNHKDNYLGVTNFITGGFSDAVHDYVDLNIMDRLLTPKGQDLLKIVDPYEYRDRLTMPKYILNGSMDEFFVPDSSQYYINELSGPTYMRYVPNAGHGLNQNAEDEAAYFFKAVAAGAQLPEYSWTVENFSQRIRLETTDVPVSVKLWQATNPVESDFRAGAFGGSYVDTVLTDQGGGVYIADVAPPATGATAYFIEMVYNVNGDNITFTTEARVLFPVPAVIELSDLQSVNGGDGSQGFIINGINVNDRSGHSVSSAGDINGDGFDDLIIGVYNHWSIPEGEDGKGESYIVFGKATGYTESIDLSSLNGTNGFAIKGIDNQDHSGKTVSSAGDINGDGFDDLIIGAYGADPGGNSDAGESYVIFGKAIGYAASFNLSDLLAVNGGDGSQGFVINGIDPGDNSGWSVSSLGDINSDGFDDIIIGAWHADPNGNFDAGETYVIFGKATGYTASMELSSLNGTNGFVINGINANDILGHSVSSAGDINGDGFDDIIIGAYQADPNENSAAGESYVIFGKASGFATSINLSSLNGTNGFIINGIDIGDQSGVDVGSAGDMNGDGIDDIVIGANGTDFNGNSNTGKSYVIFGKTTSYTATFDLSSLNGTNGFVINGIDNDDQSGGSVRTAGDINGDGFDDLIIGAYVADPNGNTNAGESYVIFGKSSGYTASMNLSSLNGNNGFVINGIAYWDLSGTTVSSAGDINGDGYDDLIIGAYEADANGNSNAGETYVLFGRDFRNEVAFKGTDLDEVIVGLIGDDLIVGGRGNDTIDGGPGNDVIHAGAGNDVIIYDPQTDTLKVDGGSGEDTLQIAGFGIDFNLTTLNQTENYQLYEDIEIIDLTGTGNNTLTLTAFDLLHLSSSTNTLRVDGNAGDKVIANGTWSDQGTTVINLQTYFVYQSGQAILQVHQNIEQSGIFVPTPDFELSDLLPVNGGDGSEGFIINGGSSFNFSGISVSSAGDINGDGFDDFLIGADGFVNYRGRTYVIFGTNAGYPAEFEVADINGTNGFFLTGVSNFDGSGISVSSAGDVNGDNFDDLIIGAPNVNSDAGAAYVFFGKASGFSTNVSLSSLNGTNGFIMNGIAANDLTGHSVSSAGDFNNDGFDDILVGAYKANGNAGATYLIYGKNTAFTSPINLSTLSGADGFVLNGIDANDRSGWSVSSAGDINGDGFADILIGALDADPNSNNNAGETYLVYGTNAAFGASFDLSTLNGTNGFIINGIVMNDRVGVSVSSAGDINNDGFDDILIGAYEADPNSNAEAGESYVVFGKNTAFATNFDISTLNGTNGFVLNGIAQGSNSGYSVSSAGDVNADGLDDIIIGAFSSDLNGDNNQGQSFLFFGKAAGTYAASVDLSSLDGISGFRINGINIADTSGTSVSAAGDVNGDGFDDIIIGAPHADPNGSASGESYILFGRDFRNEGITPLVASGTSIASSQTSPLTSEDLQPVLQEAIARLSTVIDPSLFENIQVTTADLNGQLLGREQNDNIVIDTDAAGFGWFVDSTPGDDSEFQYDPSTGQLQAVTSDATGRIDLLTALMHELGHSAGLEHNDSESSVMNSQLEAGTRSADLSDIDSFFSDGSQLAVVLDA